MLISKSIHTFLLALVTADQKSWCMQYCVILVRTIYRSSTVPYYKLSCIAILLCHLVSEDDRYWMCTDVPTTITQPNTEITVLKLDALPPTCRCHKDCKTTIVLLMEIIHPCPKFNGGIAKASTMLGNGWIIISRNVDVITYPWAKSSTGWLYPHNN